MTGICVYCGSSFGARPEYAALAAALGQSCAKRSLRVVYGGSSVGLMGTLADAALAAGGEVVGVIPQALVNKEIAHRGLSRLITVNSMHERKLQMSQLADAFVALPGGIGTLEEVIEAFTWLQLGVHLKPVGLLNCAGFYDPLIQLLSHMCQQKFLTPHHFAMLTVAENVESLLDTVTTTRHKHLPKTVEFSSPESNDGRRTVQV